MSFVLKLSKTCAPNRRAGRERMGGKTARKTKETCCWRAMVKVMASEGDAREARDHPGGTDSAAHTQRQTDTHTHTHIVSERVR